MIAEVRMSKTWRGGKGVTDLLSEVEVEEAEAPETHVPAEKEASGQEVSLLRVLGARKKLTAQIFWQASLPRVSGVGFREQGRGSLALLNHRGGGGEEEGVAVDALAREDGTTSKGSMTFT